MAVPTAAETQVERDNGRDGASPVLTRGQRALLLIGSIGPLGHFPASGTVAVAVAGVPLAWWMRTWLTVPWCVGVVVVFSVVSVWLHDLGDRLLGEKDSRKLVWDELAGWFIACLAVPVSWPWGLVVFAFFAERIIDIVKVPPANVIERSVRGGLGVVGDDVIAGVYAMLLVLLVRSWVGV